MMQDREPEHNTREAENNSRLKRRAWLVVVMVLVGAATWIMYLPAKFYNPYCNPEYRYKLGEYYGPHLSTYYREALTNNLTAGGIPHIEIGDRVLVPLVDPGYLDEHKIGLERLIDYFLGYSEKSWNLTHLKVTSGALFVYRTKHPNSEIASLYSEQHAQALAEPRLAPKQEQALWCDLTKRIVDPNLK